jgi:hypothetical protein
MPSAADKACAKCEGALAHDTDGDGHLHFKHAIDARMHLYNNLHTCDGFWRILPLGAIHCTDAVSYGASRAACKLLPNGGGCASVEVH